MYLDVSLCNHVNVGTLVKGDELSTEQQLINILDPWAMTADFSSWSHKYTHTHGQNSWGWSVSEHNVSDPDIDCWQLNQWIEMLQCVVDTRGLTWCFAVGKKRNQFLLMQSGKHLKMRAGNLHISIRGRRHGYETHLLIKYTAETFLGGNRLSSERDGKSNVKHTR